VALLTACPSDGPRDQDAGAELPPLPPIVEVLPAPAQQARPAERLALALVGEVRGEIDPCGCPTNPMGGFERRAGLLDELRAEGWPLFHLDAGNLLVEGYATGGRGDTQSRGELMVDLSAAVGLDAYCPGPADIIAMQPAQLLAAFQAQGVAIVSATWTDASGQPLFPAAAVVERGGVRLGVLGLSSQARDSQSRDSVGFIDPVRAATQALESLPADLDLVVALSNLSDEENDRVARQVPALAALLSTRYQAYDEPRRRGEGLVVEAPNRGRWLTVLRIRAAGEPGQVLELDYAEQLGLDTRDRIAAKLQRLAAKPDAPALPERDVLALDELDRTLATRGAGYNLAYVEAIPLGTRYATDPLVSERIQVFKQEVLDEAVASIEAAASQERGPPAYVSSSPCFPCHLEQFSRWALTRHTQAYEPLVARGEQRNPECLSCHTTGFAVPGGWAEVKPINVRRFKAVQCEACHGPLGGHPEDPEVRCEPPTEATCLRCHDQANSPDFDYRSYLARASCVSPHFDPELEPLPEYYRTPLAPIPDGPAATPSARAGQP